MLGKQIAVVSTNQTLLRFFELELSLLGCSVQPCHKMSPHVEAYDCIFVDTDTVRQYPSYQTRVITVSQKQTFSPDDGHLPWPVSVEQIDFLLSYQNSGASCAQEDNGKENVLWIEDRDRRQIRYKNQLVTLSQSEFALLMHLANEEKKPVARESLMTLFGTDEGNIADVYVCHLRKKLEQMCDRRVIETVRGVGYCLKFSLKEEEKE